MSVLEKNVVVPAVAGVFPLLGNMIDRVDAMYQKDSLDLELAKELVEDKTVERLRGLHDMRSPLIKTDAQGRKTMLLLWAHPKDYFDPDFMVAMVCPASRDKEGREIYKPDIVIRGPKANVLIIGGMSCCGSAIQAHVTQISGDEKIDAPKQPTAALAHPEHLYWLQGRMHLAETPAAKQVLVQIMRDIAHHRMPDNPQFIPQPGATDYLAYAAKAAAPAPGPR